MKKKFKISYPHTYRSVNETTYEKKNLKKTQHVIKELNRMANLRKKQLMINQKIKRLRKKYGDNPKVLERLEILEDLSLGEITNQTIRLQKDINWKQYKLRKQNPNVSSYSNLGLQI